MVEMKYDRNITIKLLDEGYINEGKYTFEYVILNLGSHPSAYISIPANHKYYKKDYHDICLDVHGGLTYSRDYLYWDENHKFSGWYIGWDYAHFGDYVCINRFVPSVFDFGSWFFNETNKKWTTEEILQEIKIAIKQLIKI